jgi:hypothetical protein
MLVMKKQVLDAYCGWLFPLLFALEERLDIANYSPYDKRVFGFVGERLLDVWLTHNGVPYRELPIVNIEGINWVKKGFRFIQRKLKARGASFDGGAVG